MAKDSGPEKFVRLAKDSTATKLRADKFGSSEMARTTSTDRGVGSDSTKKVKRQSGSDEAVREDVAPKKKKVRRWFILTVWAVSGPSACLARVPGLSHAGEAYMF